eukprot:449701-Pleurochrysis_carterae.AAC.1
MKLRTTVAAASARVAWDPRKHAIHAGSGDIGRSELSRVGIVRVRARTVSASMRTLRKASTFRIVWVNEVIYQRANQDALNSAHVHWVYVRLHIAQLIGADQLAQ